MTPTIDDGPAPNPTVAPFNTGLNGVNQPVNLLFRDVLWWSLGILALIVLGIRIVELSWAKLRLVMSMAVPGEKQAYWKLTQWSWMPGLKEKLMYAPLWKKRHNREIRLSSAVNMGTLPSRLHAVLLLAYVGSNIAYMFLLNWKNENKYSFCAELRGRSGTLALVNMIPLIILAARNNPLIALLQISFDTYNLLHRWIGRIVVIETVIHLISWAYVQVADGGWESVKHKILHDRFIGWGTIGTVSMVLIFIFSASPLRHAFYETFLNAHIILALVAFIGTWIHCVAASVEGGLPQLPWIIAIMIMWMVERLARMFRLAYCNLGKRGYTEAHVEALPGNACRVTMKLPRFLNVKPGQHAYLRFSRLSPWENHPFSIAWYEHEYEEEALPFSVKETLGGEKTKMNHKPVATTVCFVVGAQKGFTGKLYKAAEAKPSRAITLGAAFEGPYAGHHSLDSYGHCVLFAGATGITHQISYVRHLIDGFNQGIVATRRITLIWTIRDFEALEWVRPWMDQILHMPNRKELLRIKLFITRPKDHREISSPSTKVQMFPGRPNIPMLLMKEVHEQVGAMCVTVCGPGGLADDVRDAVRNAQKERQTLDFVEESFTW
ncbi:putative ferric reductase [Rhypophila decipiens]|uniref:ferric-chelate reductase (NADPH) n=1 Tax=Rhypophila decipiens TaxID=261697 RepID=A0AAN7B2Q3_9PEZI|nr:putative ferric reductase [Rhypophila decipiens]